MPKSSETSFQLDAAQTSGTSPTLNSDNIEPGMRTGYQSAGTPSPDATDDRIPVDWNYERRKGSTPYA